MPPWLLSGGEEDLVRGEKEWKRGWEPNTHNFYLKWLFFCGCTPINKKEKLIDSHALYYAQYRV